ncbi:MAG: cytochrome ubiquinol oxidase subunit I [Candidatus Xenobium sp.]|nr:cytochrome ubiquinol oxidase subunit I [Burkholderiales bacterium]
MDPVLLARIQFGMTIGFHFLFPLISIGLAWLLVVLEGMAWRTGDATWKSAAVFFGKVFALVFAVGVATGITMEFQFGTNWASYSRFVGDIFGAPLAAEGIFAFFLESSFLGLYLFGRNRVSAWLHWTSILMVALGATMSAFWILVANSWQQTPAGYVLDPATGRPVLTSFAEAVFNPSTWPRFFHTITACLVCGAFMMSALSAELILRGKAVAVARRSLGVGIVAAAIFSLLVAFPFGDIHARQVALTNPEKFAALEGLYETREGGAGLILFAIPRTDPPRLEARIEIPFLTSLMVHGDPHASIPALDSFPPDRVARGAELPLVFLSFHNMVALGMLFIGVSWLGLFFWWRGTLHRQAWLLRVLRYSWPLPLAAGTLGWMAAEIGRQPWIVYGLLRTGEAASKSVKAGEVLASIVMFGIIYALLGALWLFLLYRKVQQGPEEVA